jgi:hypothetical protein
VLYLREAEFSALIFKNLRRDELKKTIVCLVLFLGITSFLLAEEKVKDPLRFSNLTISLGQGAFTGGLDGTIRWKSSTKTFFITGNHEREYGVFLWKFPLNFQAGISGGAYKNMPWIGPYILFSPVKPLSFLYWKGWKAGEIGKPGTDIGHFFESMGVFLNLGYGLSLSYVKLTFFDTVMYLPGASFSTSINDQFKVFLGVDHKSTEKKLLVRIGVSYFPKK